jgi:hypothetical protein
LLFEALCLIASFRVNRLSTRRRKDAAIPNSESLQSRRDTRHVDAGMRPKVSTWSVGSASG